VNNGKPQLVLDLAGVLVSNFSSTFWPAVCGESGLSFQRIREQFDEVRKDLWTGKLREDDFWIWLCNRIHWVNREEARKLLIQSLEPLPAIHSLGQWSQIADIHVLSNHCKEWLVPILDQIKPHTKSITISNQVGLSKPDIQIYHHVAEYFDDYGDSHPMVLYIDDQEKNLIPAINLGWNTLLADNEHQWLHQVEPILSGIRCMK